MALVFVLYNSKFILMKNIIVFCLAIVLCASWESKKQPVEYYNACVDLGNSGISVYNAIYNRMSNVSGGRGTAIMKLYLKT